MKKGITIAATAVTTLILPIAVGFVVLFTGAYDVGATAEHWPATRWALGTLKASSVSARADGVSGSPPTDPEAILHGLEHYDAMCAGCHGAPGVPRGEIGRGINPEPPDLSEEAEEWTNAELFWITKHGIRLAGMPAFGPTHSDEEIWSLVAFMRQLRGMTDDEYAARVAGLTADSVTTDGGNAHDEAAGDHHH